MKFLNKSDHTFRVKVGNEIVVVPVGFTDTTDDALTEALKVLSNHYPYELVVFTDDTKAVNTKDQEIAELKRQLEELKAISSESNDRKQLNAELKELGYVYNTDYTSKTSLDDLKALIAQGVKNS